MLSFRSTLNKLARPYSFAGPRATRLHAPDFPEYLLPFCLIRTELARVKKNVRFGLDDASCRARSWSSSLYFLCPLPSRAGSLQCPKLSYGRLDVIGN